MSATQFRAAVEAKDHEGMVAALSPDVVFHSPGHVQAVRGPRGRRLRPRRRSSQVFEDFRYTDELREGDDDGARLRGARRRPVRAGHRPRARGRRRAHRGLHRARPAALGPHRAGGGDGQAPRRAMTGYLGLGSNVGDRRANLQAAVDALPAHGVEVARVVVDLRHRPGRRGARPAVVPQRVHPDRDGPRARGAARRLQGGRARRWAASPAACATARGPIDVDLLLLGDREHRSERLTLPHEQATARRFVLIPLLELDFGLRTPDGTSLADRLAALPLDEGVRRDGRPAARLGGPQRRQQPAHHGEHLRARGVGVLRPGDDHRRLVERADEDVGERARRLGLELAGLDAACSVPSTRPIP